MSDRSTDKQHLARLTDAVAAFLRHDGESGAGERDRLLAEHHDLRDLLEPMLDDPEDDLVEDLAAGEERYVGEYRLTREIGRGGMGVVYEAVHVPLGRRVALKVLPAHVTLSPKQVERFRREAAAAAKLRHHAIVPIYDVGEADGTHYFSMELVEGRNLAQVLHDLDARPLRVVKDASYITQAVEIVARIADALHYAHDNGVLHRDVKPHNILIGDDGAVRLVDFGLARVVDRHSLSQTGDFAGTPHYASPEQISGKKLAVSARSDVFSLGVVLYELLARTRPFDGETTHQILDEIRTRDPQPVRRVNGKVPHDLGVICHKALEKDPQERYPSAGEFAADLRRFLRHEPIVAQPPGPLSRIGKAVRRNRLRVTAAMSVLLFLVGMPIVAWSKTAELRALDQAHLHKVQALLAGMLSALEVSQFRPGSESEFIHALEVLGRRYDRTLAEHPDQPQMLLDSVQVMSRLAQAYAMVGDNGAAMRQYDRGIKRLQGLVAAHSGSGAHEFRLALGGMLHDRSNRLRDTGQVGPCERDLEQSIAVYRELETADLAPAVRNALTVALAKSHSARARLFGMDHKSLAKACEEYEEALKCWDKLGDDAQNALDYARSRAIVETHLGETLRRRGRHDEARKHLRLAVDGLERLLVRVPHHSIVRYGLATAKGHLGRLEADERNDEGALALLRESEELHARLVDDFPRTYTHLVNLCVTRFRIGDILLRRAMVDQAWKTTCEAVNDIERVCAAAPNIPTQERMRARLTFLKAQVHAKLQGEDPEAVLDSFEAAVVVAREMVEREPKSPISHCHLSNTLHERGRWEMHMKDVELASATLEEALDVERVAMKLEPTSASHVQSLRKIQRDIGRLKAGGAK